MYTESKLIEQAMMRYDSVGASIARNEPQQAISIGHLSAMARSAYEGYQATRYEATGQILPGLIRDVETASRLAGTADPEVCRVRALVYDVAAALLNRVGEPALAWAAADRAMAAVECSGEPVLTALGAWRLSVAAHFPEHVAHQHPGLRCAGPAHLGELASCRYSVRITIRLSGYIRDPNLGRRVHPLPDHLGSPDPQPGLLERLPHRGVLRRLVRLDLAAREDPGRIAVGAAAD